MYMYERGTLASALIFTAKPLTDNNVEVKSLEGVGGQNFSVVGDPWFGLKILRRDFPIFGLELVGRGSPPDPSSGVTTD